MLKTKSGACFNLPILFLLGLSIYFLLSTLNIHLANGQSRTYSYFCRSSQGSHSVMVNFRGERSLINWNPGELARCTDVSNNFQSALNRGNLRFLLKRGNDICATRTDTGNRCDTILISIDSSVDENSYLLRLFDGRINVPASYMIQSSDGIYINWREYLEREPANPALQENQ